MACIHPALLFLLLFSVNSIASPTLHAPLHQEGTVSTEYPSTVWSNEAIFTLVGVCVAVVGVLIGLLSSPRLRQWLCKPFRYFSKTRRMERSLQRMDARRLLQEEYNEYLRFNDFLELRGGITSSSQPW